MRRLVLFVLLAGTALVAVPAAVPPSTPVVGGLTSPAAAIDQSKGRPGFCTNDKGVTVVVDFQQLGGTTIVRCFPNATSGTGLDALKGAGFQIAGVQRWGEAFICRIENRPAANEDVAVQGRPGYKEACIDTPPAAAYWSYWHAGNNCAWTYSQWGVKNRSFVPGGFEAWSFSLNATASTNPIPRIAAVRPGTEGGSCTTKPEAAPSSNDPDEKQSGLPGGQRGNGRSGNGGSVDPNSSSANTGALPAPLPREGTQAPSPSENVEFTGGDEARDVNEVIREQSGASAWAPWVTAAVIALLLAATALTTVRRRRARDSI